MGFVDDVSDVLEAVVGKSQIPPEVAKYYTFALLGKPRVRIKKTLDERTVVECTMTRGHGVQIYFPVVPISPILFSCVSTLLRDVGKKKKGSRGITLTLKPKYVLL